MGAGRLRGGCRSADRPAHDEARGDGGGAEGRGEEAVLEEVAEAQERRGEPDDTGFVEGAGDLGGQRQEAREIRELRVLALAPRLRRVLRLVLDDACAAGRIDRLL